MGTLYLSDGDSDGILKKAKMPLVPHKECGEQLKKAGLGVNFRLSKSFLCAGGDDVIDTCKVGTYIGS